MIRIGTRRSALALAQAKLVAEELEAQGQGQCELVPITTSGDSDARTPAPDTDAGTRGPDTTASAPGSAADKSRWVVELEEALSSGEIDLAVHSAKDVPGELADGLALLGSPARAAAEDVLCGVAALEQLAQGARVGTSSIRRVAQLRAARADLDVVAIRGNVDTRVRKLTDPAEGLDAIVLARAGLQRLGLEAQIGGVLGAERFVPAPGQGALALEGRAQDERMSEAVGAITDADAFACLLAERALARALDASCHTPLGAHAVPAGCGCLNLRAWVGLPDGSAWVTDELLGGFYDPEALGERVAERMRAAGATELLVQAQTMAPGA